MPENQEAEGIASGGSPVSCFVFFFLNTKNKFISHSHDSLKWGVSGSLFNTLFRGTIFVSAAVPHMPGTSSRAWGTAQ